MDNKKPFVARLPESAGQRQGFQGQRCMPSRERLPAYGRTESLGRDGGGKGEEPNYLHCLHCMQKRRERERERGSWNEDVDSTTSFVFF